MSLMDEIKAAGEKKGPNCNVALVLAKLAPKDAEDLKAAVADHGLQLSQIERALKKRDIDLSASSISRHRKGGCRCG